jgi:hypothetical protein
MALLLIEPKASLRRCRSGASWIATQALKPKGLQD